MKKELFPILLALVLCLALLPAAWAEATAGAGTATFGGQSVAGSWSFTNAAPKRVSDSGNSVSVTFTPR